MSNINLNENQIVRIDFYQHIVSYLYCEFMQRQMKYMLLYLRDTEDLFWDIEFTKEHWFKKRYTTYEYHTYLNTQGERIHRFKWKIEPYFKEDGDVNVFADYQYSDYISS